MTFISKKTPEFLRSEIKTVEDYTDQVFGMQIDLQSFKGQIEELAIKKLQDYIFQRYRDWPIKELLMLFGELGKLQVERCAAELEPEPDENRAAHTKVLKRGRG